MTAAALVPGLVPVGTGFATAGQAAFERDVDGAIDDVRCELEHEGASTVAARSEYADYSPFTGPETGVVEASRSDG